jgi:hypothetical protein
MLKSLLEGRIRSEVTCSSCHTSLEAPQPVWIMTLPVMPDLSSQAGDAAATAKLTKRDSSKEAKIGGKERHRLKDNKNTKGPSSKELKQQAKAQKRREKQLRKQHADAGADDLVDGNLSGATRRTQHLHRQAELSSELCTATAQSSAA